MTPLSAGSAGEPELRFVVPRGGEVVFGRSRVELELVGVQGTLEVELRLDGRTVARLPSAPYTVEVDLGDENRERRLEAVAHRPGDVPLRTVVTLPAVRIDEQVELDLQQLYATVLDDRGDRVAGLERDDFRLFDEERPQEIVTLSHGDVAFTAILLLDGSESMRGRRWEVARESAQSFLEALGPHDEVKLMVASDRLLLNTPFSRSASRLLEPLAGAEPDGGTAIVDHLYLSLSLLERRQGRRVVILLSDGWDLESVLEVDELRRAARLSQALIYWVRMRGDEPRTTYDFGVAGGVRPGAVPIGSWRTVSAGRRGYRRLEEVVRASGGRIDSVAGLEEVSGRFRDIVEELREQYAIGYYPEPRRNDGSWRRVSLQLARPGLEVRAREGYVDR